MSDLLQVGDVVIYKTFLGVNRYPITRVTKTLALSMRSDGYEHRFYRDPAKGFHYPKPRWGVSGEYSVERKQ